MSGAISLGALLSACSVVSYWVTQLRILPVRSCLWSSCPVFIHWNHTLLSTADLASDWSIRRLPGTWRALTSCGRPGWQATYVQVVRDWSVTVHVLIRTCKWHGYQAEDRWHLTLAWSPTPPKSIRFGTKDYIIRPYSPMEAIQGGGDDLCSCSCKWHVILYASGIKGLSILAINSFKTNNKINNYLLASYFLIDIYIL